MTTLAPAAGRRVRLPPLADLAASGTLPDRRQLRPAETSDIKLPLSVARDIDEAASRANGVELGRGL